jgi:hypothetical protein
MSTYVEWRAGMILTPERLTGRQHNKVTKDADETVTSSTTYQNDNHLLFAVEANTTYFIKVVLGFGGLTAADIKTRWSIPAGATGFKWCIGPTVGTTDRENTNMINAVHAAATDRAYGCMSTVAGSISAEAQTAVEYHSLVTAGTAGTVQLEWAQNTANATGTTLRADSYIEWVPVA